MVPFVSIIIPVYNAEKTLTRCVESILSQTDNDYEVIIVDDGSTDGSLALCRQYEKTMPCLTVLHQENAGVSVARNIGISQASGEYIFFIDADDYIEPVTVALLKEACGTSNSETKYDICFFGYYIEDKRCKEVERVSPFPYKGPKNPNTLLRLMQKNLFGLACNKITRRALIQSSEIAFTVGRKVFEDQEFLMKTWEASGMVFCIDKELYHYVQSAGTAMKRSASNTLESFLKIKNENLISIENFMKNNFIGAKEIDSYLFYCASSEIGQILRLLMSLPDGEVRDGITNIRDGAIGQAIMESNNEPSFKERLFLNIINHGSAPIKLKVLKVFCRITGRV
jgi:glycosyltransferase involved in cell wall biosynthesis